MVFGEQAFTELRGSEVGICRFEKITDDIPSGITGEEGTFCEIDVSAIDSEGYNRVLGGGTTRSLSKPIISETGGALILPSKTEIFVDEDRDTVDIYTFGSIDTPSWHLQWNEETQSCSLRPHSTEQHR